MNLDILKNLPIKQVATKAFGRSGVVIQKYSPEILTGLGIVGTVTSAVLASRATLHLETNVDYHQAEVDQVKQDLRENKISANEYQKRMVKVHLATATRVARLYGPAVTLGIASIGCLLGAHGIMKKRNAAILAAYKSVEETFSKYRKRVAEELGEEREADIRRGVSEVKTVKNKETGKDEVHKTIQPGDVSEYARFFDELCPNWNPNAEYNLLFLRTQQNHANDRLKARGHLFLNEVYESLGLPHTKAGAVVGWVISKDGDNYVDFGLYDSSRGMVREFVNGNEAAILLDFNVDGVIYDKI